MSDTDSGGLTSRLAPKRGRVTLDGLTLIVRPPGRPAAIQTFTDDEIAEATAYATANNAEIEQLR
ncbi:hypothetical protein FOV72_20870 [Gordonia rubripertincta]|uniref:hypothetical protein n=1 Tax=Gordonia rubripertincta TaxID=36822 RepID=UPI00117D684A|nr:hypothetical protein [Gordonia rubripertincta]TSD93104.1 hypothetical protein FOV72_20870 [Gordonia rubripertincta]